MNIFLTIAAATLCLGEAVAVVKNEETFDYLMLSQEWPYSFCSTMECQNTDKLQSLFNIHGLWPEHVSGSCQGSFNYSQLKPIETQLRQAWMDLKNPEGDPEEFWSREYGKHGRCATVDSRYSTTFLYFQAAVNLHNTYILTEMLNKSGIVPGPNPIKASRIRDAVTAGFGQVPELSCVTKDQKLYLLELRLCFEKDLSPRNCASSSRSRGTSRSTLPRLLSGGSLKYEADVVESPAPEQLDLLIGNSPQLQQLLASRSRNQPLHAEECNADAEVLLLDKLGE